MSFLSYLNLLSFILKNEDLDALNIKLSKDKLLLEKELAAFQQERCDGRKQSNLLKTEVSKKCSNQFDLIRNNKTNGICNLFLIS